MKPRLALPLIVVLALMGGAVQAEDLPLFHLEMKEGVVSPQRLEVPAGKKFKIEIKNSGKVAVEFECKPLKKEKVLAPGTSAVMEIQPLSEGEYTFVDEFREYLPTSRGVIVAKPLRENNLDIEAAVRHKGP